MWRVRRLMNVARAAINEAAAQVIADNETANDVCGPPSPTATPAAAAGTPTPTPTAPPLSVSDRLPCIQKQVDALPIPLGWGSGSRPDGATAWVAAIGGWLFTAAALSLGAPFWFDALKRLVNLRQTGEAKK
jgi:hypothetical protein